MEPTSTAELSSRFVIRAHDLRLQAPSAHVRRRYPLGGAWRERLRRALRDGRLVLHYQPMVALREGRVAGARPGHFEALIRLADERGRLAAPAEFLPAAERYGLIGEIDRWALAEAIRLMGEELGDGEERIAVNLSALSVTDQGMLGYIEGQLARRRVAPRRLIVEVTETSAISDMALAREFCEGLSRLGAAVALDDFGAGFGSFQYLKQLPFHYLKIDGEFIRALPHSHKDRLLVQALVALARGMGGQTIAEYVCEPHTVELLRELGVDYAQGFELGRPACPRDAFAALL